MHRALAAILVLLHGAVATWDDCIEDDLPAVSFDGEIGTAGTAKYNKDTAAIEVKHMDGKSSSYSVGIAQGADKDRVIRCLEDASISVDDQGFITLSGDQDKALLMPATLRALTSDYDITNNTPLMSIEVDDFGKYFNQFQCIPAFLRVETAAYNPGVYYKWADLNGQLQQLLIEKCVSG